MSKKKNNKPGPQPETITAKDVDWKDVMKHALDTPKPQDKPEQDKPQDDEQAEPAAD